MLEIKQIKYLETFKDLKNVVIQIEWEYSLEGFQSISGQLSLSEPKENEFIPIEQVTEDVALEWVKKFINPEKLELQENKEVQEIKTITFKKEDNYDKL